jgi:hypothetical protein
LEESKIVQNNEDGYVCPRHGVFPLVIPSFLKFGTHIEKRGSENICI